MSVALQPRTCMVNACKVFMIIMLLSIGICLFCPRVEAGPAGQGQASQEQIAESNVAGDEPSARKMIGSVVRIVTTLCTVVGIILGIVGLVKFIIAHANEQGPEQQKAVMWIAVAIILVIVPNVISAVANSWIPLINTGG